MVRTIDDERAVRFERRELDGRSHSDWVLDATFRDDPGGVDRGGDDPGGVGGDRRAVLRMRLHYGGSLWLPVLDRLLSDEIERSRPRLVALVA
jgi:hypothetical protein